VHNNEFFANFGHRVGLRRCAANPTYGFRFLLGYEKLAGVIG
jgi:hypothetical protein